MHSIVGILEGEAKDRVATLKIVELILCGATVLALIIEAFLVFEPAASKICSQFREVAESKNRLSAELAALNRSTARAELSPAGIIVNVNDQLLGCLEYQRSDLLNRHYSILEEPANECPIDGFWNELLSGHYQSKELVWNTKSGEARILQATFNPVFNCQSQIDRIVVYCNDVTLRHQDELEKQRLNAELNEAARKAGMAEVATGVLHNVGNVLNSVNTSASMLRDQITSIPLRRLTKASEIIVENQHNLADFLTNDERGRAFPAFLRTLSTSFESGQSELLNEAKELTKSVNHIIEIVAMQQSVARSSGVIEKIDVNELVDDAIRMNESSFSRYNTKLIREFEDCPEILSRRHEVLQILVNLMKNAQQATLDVDRTATITIRTRPASNEFIIIEIEDNGIGIAKKNLSELFQYGFTTKKSGNGFGLHSSANTANYLGGSISVASDGRDCGATFTLRLPIRNVKNVKNNADTVPENQCLPTGDVE